MIPRQEEGMYQIERSRKSNLTNFKGDSIRGPFIDDFIIFEYKNHMGMI